MDKYLCEMISLKSKICSDNSMFSSPKNRTIQFLKIQENHCPI